MTLFAWLVPTLFLTPSAPQLPVAPPPRVALDPELAKHLAAWKKVAGSRQNVRAEVTFTRTDVVFRKPKTYNGSFQWMRPNLFRLKLGYDGDKSGNDFETFVCDGKTIYEYSGLGKTIIEWPLTPAVGNRPAGPPTEAEYWASVVKALLARGFELPEQFAIKCLTGRVPEEELRRCNVTLVRVDPHYIYLDIEAVLASDRAEFHKVRLALTGPENATPYLAVSMHIVRPNGDSESWRFKDVKADVPGVGKKDFEFQPLPGFKVQKATGGSKE